MLTEGEHQKRFHGMKLARHCPSVTHLLFADDSLFFCRASTADCREIASILQRYEAMSGQKVNFDKSSIIFGMRISEERKRIIQRILGIDRIGGGGKYLGLPEQFGRKKVDLFEFITQRIRDKLDGWYNKFLSPAGREVMIKSVAQSMPIYSMNCFLLPKIVCDDIDSLLSEFWWGKGKERRKISWVAWKRLSLPKDEGGLGFKDLHNFNLALLGKQAWRILMNPHSLLARLYKGRYHHSSMFLQSSSGAQASYGWKSIQEGKKLLTLGLRKQLGNGKTTNVWEDAWLPTLPPRRVQGHQHNSAICVADLWVEGTRRWDHAKLDVLLDVEDATLAKNLILSQHAMEDTYIWPYTKDSNYSVKSGYWVATHIIPEDDRIVPPAGSIHLKTEVWKLPIIPKIKHFLWNVLSGALSTATRLCTRGVNINPECQRCCLEDESINHLLFQCPFATMVWRCSNIHTFDHPSSDLEANIRSLLDITKSSTMPPHLRLLPLWIPWILWKSRNEFIFERRNAHPNDEATRALQATTEWNASTFQEVVSQHDASDKSSAWEPPPIGWLKCNFDGSYQRHQETTGIGWIIRDHHGQHIQSGTAKLQRSQTALQAEALAFLHVLQMIWVQGRKHVWFEGDCSEITRLINNGGQNSELGNILYDLRFWISKLPLCSLGNVNRERNQVADTLAKKSYETDTSCTIFSIPPFWIMNMLYHPFTI